MDDLGARAGPELEQPETGPALDDEMQSRVESQTQHPTVKNQLVREAVGFHGYAASTASMLSAS